MLKRYSFVSLLIITCFLSAFVALYHGVTSMLQIMRMIQEENEYQYLHTVKVTIMLTEPLDVEALFQLVEGIETGNIVIVDYDQFLYFDQLDGMFLPTIILKLNEPLSIPSSKPLHGIPKGSLIISSTRLDGNQQLSIKERTLELYEVINGETHPFFNSTLINAEDYFDLYPNSLTKDLQIDLYLGSNHHDLYQAYAKMEENLQQLVPDARIFATEISTQTNPFQAILTQGNILFIGLFGFALLNTIMISYYWIIVRRREIAIRKAFGHTNLSIMKLLAKELAGLIGLSALISFTVQVPFSFHETINFLELFWLATVFIGAVALAVVIAMIVPAGHIMKIQPAEGMKRS
nr:FtsX-like permease family protein [Insulibacter thermoxylanivorax]